jgi:hypothetical protein
MKYLVQSCQAPDNVHSVVTFFFRQVPPNIAIFLKETPAIPIMLTIENYGANRNFFIVKLEYNAVEKATAERTKPPGVFWPSEHTTRSLE